MGVSEVTDCTVVEYLDIYWGEKFGVMFSYGCLHVICVHDPEEGKLVTVIQGGRSPA